MMEFTNYAAFWEGLQTQSMAYSFTMNSNYTHYAVDLLCFIGYGFHSQSHQVRMH